MEKTRKEPVPHPRRGVYGISVASELSGVDPQSMRLYERRGLLSPARTRGGTRRYSDDDVARLRRISELLSEGINLAGIAQIFRLESHHAELASHNARLESHNARLESDNARLEDANARLESDNARLRAATDDSAATS
ncbi:MerR family transcriptional regulator [Rhodococcus ruber]|uniref:Heat shock protein transcriptional repressor HspR n=1 Tax=Rhodococcus ruber TaxID=1830 RepID=A0A098BTB0_9NOCA|nr:MULTISPECIES: MerR family transcriptional regulator [Rhodococcus]MCD2127128.1 MerR family transcriptional regulator [Rhodococcus ruber]MCZ1074622.1 MerR family transcriptional regulator [Rhodococcus sp. A5(2022)]MCZ4503274.1 MerR family transcriptional regulator [Rhodococcus ruber]MCZ4530631.1 MerR family transcriptional regulator [Rhodococcus ruber]MCZ4621669.1 MerR family transcriptional regulator [Rhodococcus ruber]